MLIAARPCCIQVVISSLLRVAVFQQDAGLVEVGQHREGLHHAGFGGDDPAVLGHVVAAEAV